jgi:hypothetical protein
LDRLKQQAAERQKRFRFKQRQQAVLARILIAADYVTSDVYA